MKKDGFTLVELIAVIAVLALIMIIALPAINNSGDKAKQKTFETKVSSMETAAIMYGQENKGTILKSGTISGNYRTELVTVSKLIPEYISPDNDVSDNKKMNDPRNSSHFLDECKIKIMIDMDTKKVTAEFQDSTC